MFLLLSIFSDPLHRIRYFCFQFYLSPSRQLVNDSSELFQVVSNFTRPASRYLVLDGRSKGARFFPTQFHPVRFHDNWLKTEASSLYYSLLSILPGPLHDRVESVLETQQRKQLEALKHGGCLGKRAEREQQSRSGGALHFGHEYGGETVITVMIISVTVRS